MSATCVDAYDGGKVNGTVSGLALSVQDAIFFLRKDSAGRPEAINVIMADKPNLCETLKANRMPRSSTSLFFSLLNVKTEGGSSTLLAPDVGDHTVTDGAVTSTGQYARASFSSSDASCTSTLTYAASTGLSGQVKVTALKAEANGSLQATFDLSIGTQADALTGSVNAHFCDVTSLSDHPTCE